MNESAGESPAEIKARFEQRKREAHVGHSEANRKLAIAFENVLGKDGARREDQETVYRYLTDDRDSVAGSMDTNILLMFEGQRRKAIAIVELLRYAAELSKKPT